MTIASAARPAWRTAHGAIALDRPVILGILNASPDSFWSGGRIQHLDQALRHANQLIEEGADALDVGGESTRPGATAVPAAEEAARVTPLVRAIARRWPSVPLSVDTVKAGVAQQAVEVGAWIVNDVSGLRLDAALGSVVASQGAGIVLMHSRGGVDRMAGYDLATYGPDPVGDIAAELGDCIERARAAGIPDDAIVIDPGIGFSKRTEHSTAVIAGLDRFTALGFPILVGPSRKRFIGEIGGGLPPAERLEGTLAACVAALDRGARIFRVHDVRAARRALDVAWAIAGRS